MSWPSYRRKSDRPLPALRALPGTIGAAISPAIAGFLIASPVTIDLLFYLAGGLKSAYDLLLYRSFIKVRPPEETTAPTRQQLSCDRSNTEKGAESV